MKSERTTISRIISREESLKLHIHGSYGEPLALAWIKLSITLLLVALYLAPSRLDAQSPPASLQGKVFVGYWGNKPSEFEYHYFATANKLIFKDNEEHGQNEYKWDKFKGIMRDLTFEERFQYEFSNLNGGTFTSYENSSQLIGSGSFVCYEGEWDLDGNGKADGQDIQLGKMPDIRHPLNLASDEDKDGLGLAAEGKVGANPKKKDSDGDQFSDGDEVLVRKTNPKAFDDGIVSSMSKMTLVIKKLMPKYMLASNFGARDFTVTNLPPGLKYSKTTGVISGAPNKTGTYPVSITARKIQGGKAVKTAKATKVFEVK
jgi:hypothetical protein